MTARILVAGVGNIFLGDDAFGVEVVRQLAAQPQPDGVRVADFGIRGFDLAFALMDEHDLSILVDALPRGGAPGTLYVLEPDAAELEAPAEAAMIDTHGMHPLKVLRLVWSLGGRPKAVRVVGCEPLTFGSEEEPAMGLSEPVQAAVPAAVRLIEALIHEAILLLHEPAAAGSPMQASATGPAGGEPACIRPEG